MQTATGERRNAPGIRVVSRVRPVSLVGCPVRQLVRYSATAAGGVSYMGYATSSTPIELCFVVHPYVYGID